MTIECPQGFQLSLHSKGGRVMVEQGAELAFVGCDVMTVATRAAAATGPPPLAYTDDYFGTSRGTLRFLNSRLLLPSEARTPLTSKPRCLTPLVPPLCPPPQLSIHYVKHHACLY